jgi:hypothetical protein
MSLCLNRNHVKKAPVYLCQLNPFIVPKTILTTGDTPNVKEMSSSCIKRTSKNAFENLDLIL